VLARQSKTKIGLVDLATVARGTDAIHLRLAELSVQGFGAAIVDAVFDTHLEITGRAAIDHRLSVGASGMGLGLARAIAAKSAAKTNSVITMAKPIGGPVACLAGSCSQATLAQIAEAEKTMAVLRLDPEKILTGNSEVERALDWSRQHLADRPILIASSATPDQVTALQKKHGRDAAGHAIERTIATISERLADAGVRRFVIAGGETSGAVVDRLGVLGFLVGAEIAPGVPVLRAVGWQRGDAVMALKSGNFGGADFFNDAIRLMP
jgi:uncharacterized protein YgbK (DUF1537 family)